MTRSFLSLHAKPGRRGELLALLEQVELLAVVSEQPGFLAAEVATAVDDEDRVVVVGSWASAAHHDRWLASPLSRSLARRLADLLVAPPDVRVYRVVESVS